MIATLVEKTWTPCRGGIPPLTPEEAEEYRAQAPEWGLRDEARRIESAARLNSPRRRRTIPTSASGGYATVSLRTKKIKGLHDNDFIMAVKLDRLASGAATDGSAG